jgi:hypothetical protein
LVLSEGPIDGRSSFLEFLDSVGVGGIASHPRRELFLLNQADICFSELSVDSLSLMEIGVGLEEDYGASLSPHELARFTSVGSLWGFVSGHASGDDA